VVGSVFGGVVLRAYLGDVSHSVSAVLNSLRIAFLENHPHQTATPTPQTAS